VLLLGGALDGHPATAAISDVAMLPVGATASAARCAGVGLADALAQTAALIAAAPHAPAVTVKNEGTRALLHTAGWPLGGCVVAVASQMAAVGTADIVVAGRLSGLRIADRHWLAAAA